jgi:glycosyltransferase involved in cell wall biosynthesis
MAELKQLATELGIASQISFTGPVVYEDIPGYLAAADAFVTASVSEVHPLTVIEAMATGLPVVASASPGIVDTVIHGDSGLLTNQPKGGLAAAMVAMALDVNRRQQMGCQAQANSQRFDINQTVKRTAQLYTQLQRTRPDLRREKEHGRWVRQRNKLQPHLDQMIRLIKPPEKLGTGPLRKLFELAPEKDKVRE